MEIDAQKPTPSSAMLLARPARSVTGIAAKSADSGAAASMSKPRLLCRRSTSSSVGPSVAAIAVAVDVHPT
jgi:hypothetical protein